MLRLCQDICLIIFLPSPIFYPSRALGKFSECQDNMSFHVQNWPDSNDWSDIPSKKEAKKKERKKKGEKKE